MVEPPHLLRLEQVSERSNELTFTSRVSRESDFNPGEVSEMSHEDLGCRGDDHISEQYQQDMNLGDSDLPFNEEKANKPDA